MNPEIIKRIVALYAPETIIRYGAREKKTKEFTRKIELMILIQGVREVRPIVNRLYKELAEFNEEITLFVDDPKIYHINKKMRIYHYYEIHKTGVVVYERTP